MFAAGCRASASVKGQPSLPASSEPTVDLPLPDTPATTTIMTVSLSGPGPPALAVAPRGDYLPLLMSGGPRDGGGAVPAVSNLGDGMRVRRPLFMAVGSAAMAAAVAGSTSAVAR